MSEIKQNLLQDDIRTKFLFYLQRNSIEEEKPIIKSPHMLTIKELSKKLL